MLKFYISPVLKVPVRGEPADIL